MLRRKSCGKSMCRFETGKVEMLPLKENEPLEGNGSHKYTCNQIGP